MSGARPRRVPFVKLGLGTVDFNKQTKLNITFETARLPSFPLIGFRMDLWTAKRKQGMDEKINGKK